MSDLTVLEPGTEVTLIGGIKGIILCVMIEDGPRVSYKVMWPAGADLKEQWVASFVIKPPDDNLIRVGFGGTL